MSQCNCRPILETIFDARMRIRHINSYAKNRDDNLHVVTRCLHHHREYYRTNPYETSNEYRSGIEVQSVLCHELLNMMTFSKAPPKELTRRTGTFIPNMIKCENAWATFYHAFKAKGDYKEFQKIIIQAIDKMHDAFADAVKPLRYRVILTHGLLVDNIFWTLLSSILLGDSELTIDDVCDSGELTTGEDFNFSEEVVWLLSHRKSEIISCFCKSLFRDMVDLL